MQVTESQRTYTARVISEGTLRILGLLAITQGIVPLTVVGYEEPENGVQPRRLRQVAELLKSASRRYGRQFIIITHSPKFPEFFASDELVVCRKDGDGTRFEKFPTFGPLYAGEKRQAIEESIDEENGATSLADRMIRGDFDA